MTSRHAERFKRAFTTLVFHREILKTPAQPQIDNGCPLAESFHSIYQLNMDTLEHTVEREVAAEINEQ